MQAKFTSREPPAVRIFQSFFRIFDHSEKGEAGRETVKIQMKLSAIFRPNNDAAMQATMKHWWEQRSCLPTK